MEVKIETVGRTEVDMIFEDHNNPVYPDCVRMTIRGTDGICIIQHTYVKIDELKRLGKSL